jgi:hypothetical protein
VSPTQPKLQIRVLARKRVRMAHNRPSLPLNNSNNREGRIKRNPSVHSERRLSAKTAK